MNKEKKMKKNLINNYNWMLFNLKYTRYFPSNCHYTFHNIWLIKLAMFVIWMAFMRKARWQKAIYIQNMQHSFIFYFFTRNASKNTYIQIIANIHHHTYTLPFTKLMQKIPVSTSVQLFKSIAFTIMSMPAIRIHISFK